MKRGEKLDQQYISLVEKLLLSNRKCSIATHHDKVQKNIKELINKHAIPKTNYEFEMLYGIREDLLKNLHQEEYPCRHLQQNEPLSGGTQKIKTLLLLQQTNCIILTCASYDKITRSNKIKINEK